MAGVETMKFANLPVGAQFVYQGETYSKLNAIMGVHAETGRQKLIPRFARVDVTATTGSGGAGDVQVPLNAACDEFRQWYAECRAYLQGIIEDGQRDEALKTLDEASEAFVRGLERLGGS